VRRVGGPDGAAPSADAAVLASVGDGYGEAPASAPMDIPDTAGGGTIGGSTQEGQNR
jgi:hypothetical protein